MAGRNGDPSNRDSLPQRLKKLNSGNHGDSLMTATVFASPLKVERIARRIFARYGVNPAHPRRGAARITSVVKHVMRRARHHGTYFQGEHHDHEDRQSRRSANSG